MARARAKQMSSLPVPCGMNSVTSTASRVWQSARVLIFPRRAFVDCAAARQVEMAKRVRARKSFGAGCIGCGVSGLRFDGVRTVRAFRRGVDHRGASRIVYGNIKARSDCMCRAIVVNSTPTQEQQRAEEGRRSFVVPRMQLSSRVRQQQNGISRPADIGRDLR